MNGDAMNKPKVVIYIFLTDEGQVSIQTSSQNQITNLGMLGIAQSLIQKQIEVKQPSNIIVPEVLV